MTNKIHNLLRESSTTASSSNGRPDLVGLTRATHDLIFTDLIAIQKTNQPEATLYGVKYLNQDNKMSFNTPAVYSGAINSRKGIDELDLNKVYAIGDLFIFEDVVYKILSLDPFKDIKSLPKDEAVGQAIIDGSIRYMSDAAETSHFEQNEVEIANASVRLDRWSVPVKTRKIKTELTVEFAQDLEHNQFDAEAVIDDMISTVLAEDINKDVIQKIMTVSSRYKVNGISDKGMLDLTNTDVAPEQGRALYRYICEMNASIERNTSYDGSYVLASSRCAALLSASGWMEINPDYPLAAGVLKNGLPVYSDPWSLVDYVVVGTKQNFGDLEHVGSLFYAPYMDFDDAGSYKLVVDPESLQPRLALMARYALSTNPYTVIDADENEDKAILVRGDDWDNLVGKSKMSYILGVKLPKLVE
ncbi:head vertex protein [Morganella phage vB_MmoM_MP1]|uniref:Capsid vertex protein n=1 Tax=Morganella phage vB_MmoM_MP1 TaxID=1852628 RepID=A0A192YC39_9CAUD|nr:head vertex protein [Morganella phage vB_MmoM_MP1]ANM46421.1 head vertex protein [Morganella phage vB_MmoM_MP1]